MKRIESYVMFVDLETLDKVYSIQKMTGPRVCRGNASVLEAKEAK